MAMTDQEMRWLYTALKQIEFLKFCSIGEIEELAKGLTRKSFQKGDTIVRQGDPGDYLFLLYSGQVSIQAKSGMMSTREITKLGPGSYFGEMALVSFEPRSATVVATQDSDAFLLFAADFRKMLEKNQDLARSVDELIAKRKADRELELRKNYMRSQTIMGKLKGLFGG